MFALLLQTGLLPANEEEAFVNPLAKVPRAR